MTRNSAEDREVRPILEILARLRHGRALEEAAEELNLVVENVLQTGKKGSVVLTITVSPIQSARNGVALKIDVEGKPPEVAKQNDVMFADDDFNLFPYDPLQGDLVGYRAQERPRPIRNIPPGPVPANVDPTSGEMKEDVAS